MGGRILAVSGEEEPTNQFSDALAAKTITDKATED